MADRKVRLVGVQADGSQIGVDVGYHDNGDGTFSEETYSVNGAGAGSGALFDSSQAGTGAYVALGTQACSEVLVQNDPTSAGDLLVGGAAGVIRLVPGQAIALAVSNVNLIKIKLATASAATANWLARS